ncbi:MAG: hypothetical protein ABII82_14800 [Verrucomicrobiota bacterium]
MALKKKTSSRKLNLAETRAAAIGSIDENMDFGGGVTLAAYRTSITDSREKLSAYNALLSQADTARQAFAEAESTLSDFSDRMLANVGARYGKNSPEYLQAGGTPKVLRRRLTGTDTTTEPEAEATAA